MTDISCNVSIWDGLRFLSLQLLQKYYGLPTERFVNET